MSTQRCDGGWGRGKLFIFIARSLNYHHNDFRRHKKLLLPPIFISWFISLILASPAEVRKYWKCALLPLWWGKPWKIFQLWMIPSRASKAVFCQQSLHRRRLFYWNNCPVSMSINHEPKKSDSSPTKLVSFRL